MKSTQKYTGLIVLLLFFIVTRAMTCYKKNTLDCHSNFEIRNNSSGSIYFGLGYDSSLLLLDYPPVVSPENYKCLAFSTKEKSFGRCLEGDISYTPTKKLYFFIFDAAVLESTPWQTVKQNYMLLKRYDLTETQLDSANWVIDYP